MAGKPVVQEYFELVLDHWKLRHEPYPFSEVVFHTIDNGAIAKVDTKTHELTVDIQKLYSVATELSLWFRMFVYYVLSHELAHILYRYTDETSNEESFAHNYACQDVRIHLGNLCPAIQLDALDNLDKRLTLD